MDLEATRLRRDPRAVRGLQPRVASRSTTHPGSAPTREGRGDDAGRRDRFRAREPATAPSTRFSRRSTRRPGLPAVLKEYHVDAVTRGHRRAWRGLGARRARRPARLGPGRLDRHAGGIRARLPARCVECAGGRDDGRGAEPVQAAGTEPDPSGPWRASRPDSRDFSWEDGDRLIRFGEVREAEALDLIESRGLRRLRAADRSAQPDCR